MRWLLRSLVWLLVLALVAAALAAWFYVRQAEPKIDGEMLLPGAAGEIQISRDEHGIPSIKATSLGDAMFGLGVVHAQDRLWQLETHRRIGSGRMSEAFGEAALESDRFLRALGVKRVAEKQWARLQGESRSALEAYTAGINAVIARQTKARPPEMLILGVPLEPWTPADSLAWATMMAWDLGGNWNAELLRLRLSLRLPVERINEVMPPYPGDAPLVSFDYASRFRALKLDATAMTGMMDRVLTAAPPSGVEGVGSNNWVLAGSHTTTGHPLLANDPHLKLSAPALWYFARIEAPGLKVAGATMPGLPYVVLGQNEQLAWGFTNTGPDVQDLYLERFDATDATRVDTPEGPQPLSSVEEVIKIKGKAEQRFTARASRHGPLISDAGTVNDVLGPIAKPGYGLALRWTALDPEVDPIGVGLNMMRATSVETFAKATRDWVAPMQNMVVADRAGHIGYVAPGRVPLRHADNDHKGMVPSLGWEARYDWIGWIDPDQTPREFDPARGWIATANQRIHSPDYPHHITADWAAPFRQQRIEQMLDAKARHSLDDLRAMHADVKSLAADSLLPWLQRAKSEHPLAAAAQAALKDFDGTMHADKPAPAIYWVWLRQLTQGMLADELGPVYERSLASRQYRDAIAAALGRDDAWWCDDKATPAPETCAVQADAAFTRALDELQALAGKDVAAWRWGSLHQARSEHRPFSRVKLLARFFELRTPTGGDSFTVNVSRVNYNADTTTKERYLNEHGPSLRALYDLGDLRQSKVMHSSGQSGLPWSNHYRDFVAPWARVDYVPLWPQGQATQALIIRPER